MQRSKAELVAAVPPVVVEGVFYRHAAPNRDPFAGGTDGRWGAGFPVIYLGRPEAAPVAEAYRHLVDDTGVPARAVKRRILYSVRISVDGILDLTTSSNLNHVGLTPADLTSGIDDHDRCQEVAAAAHQLGYHCILAPAAHGLGETLALFRQRLSAHELPVVEFETVWDGLPDDPRLPRALHSRRDQRA